MNEDELTTALSSEEMNNQVIPENSNTILIDQTTARFSSAPWYETVKNQTVLIAGVGGIGSWFALLISRMKPATIWLMDPDKVEAVNMAGQLYSVDDIGSAKVVALQSTLRLYADYHLSNALPTRFTESSIARNIMICGFDNMEARKIYFNKWKERVYMLPEEARKECLFIDGRLSAECMQVFCITGEDEYYMNKYENEYLFSDDEADSVVCSYKQTTYCASMIASLMANLFVNFCANLNEPLMPRDLPFFTEYNAETMFFKTKS